MLELLVAAFADLSVSAFADHFLIRLLKASIYYGLGFLSPILQLFRRNVCIIFS
jgi:hypothetical protein